MREILFRGKEFYTGEWVEGYYVKGVTRHGIVKSFACYPRYDVIPETVGQFTGLLDKNGKRIFEGDILKGEQYPFCGHCGDYNYFAKVIWFDNSPAFGMFTFKNPKSNVRGVSTGNTSYIEDFESEDWEIIGNIHDNPELLEVK